MLKSVINKITEYINYLELSIFMKSVRRITVIVILTLLSAKFISNENFIYASTLTYGLLLLLYSFISFFYSVTNTEKKSFIYVSITFWVLNFICLTFKYFLYDDRFYYLMNILVLSFYIKFTFDTIVKIRTHNEKYKNNEKSKYNNYSFSETISYGKNEHIGEHLEDIILDRQVKNINNIAIQGEYGTGKSSFINKLQKNIESKNYSIGKKRRFNFIRINSPIFNSELKGGSGKQNVDMTVVHIYQMYNSLPHEIKIRIDERLNINKYSIISKRNSSIYLITLILILLTFFFVFAETFSETLYSKIDMFTNDLVKPYKLYRIEIFVILLTIIFLAISIYIIFFKSKIKKIKVPHLEIANESESIFPSNSQIITEIVNITREYTFDKVIIIIEDLDRGEQEYLLQELYYISLMFKNDNVIFIYTLSKNILSFETEIFYKFFDKVIDLEPYTNNYMITDRTFTLYNNEKLECVNKRLINQVYIECENLRVFTSVVNLFSEYVYMYEKSLDYHDVTDIYNKLFALSSFEKFCVLNKNKKNYIKVINNLFESYFNLIVYVEFQKQYERVKQQTKSSEIPNITINDFYEQKIQDKLKNFNESIKYRSSYNSFNLTDIDKVVSYSNITQYFESKNYENPKLLTYFLTNNFFPKENEVVFLNRNGLLTPDEQQYLQNIQNDKYDNNLYIFNVEQIYTYICDPKDCYRIGAINFNIYLNIEIYPSIKQYKREIEDTVFKNINTYQDLFEYNEYVSNESLDNYFILKNDVYWDEYLKYTSGEMNDKHLDKLLKWIKNSELNEFPIGCKFHYSDVVIETEFTKLVCLALNTLSHTTYSILVNELKIEIESINCIVDHVELDYNNRMFLREIFQSQLLKPKVLTYLLPEIADEYRDEILKLRNSQLKVSNFFCDEEEISFALKTTEYLENINEFVSYLTSNENLHTYDIIDNIMTKSKFDEIKELINVYRTKHYENLKIYKIKDSIEQYEEFYDLLFNKLKMFKISNNNSRRPRISKIAKNPQDN